MHVVSKKHMGREGDGRRKGTEKEEAEEKDFIFFDTYGNFQKTTFSTVNIFLRKVWDEYDFPLILCNTSVLFNFLSVLYYLWKLLNI